MSNFHFDSLLYNTYLIKYFQKRTHLIINPFHLNKVNIFRHFKHICDYQNLYLFQSIINLTQEMQEPYEESLVKIDAVISGIRMINLNIFNHLNEYINPRQKDFRENKEKDPRQQFKSVNISHLQQNMKFINEYLRKCLKDISKTKVSLSPLIYRSFRTRIINDEDFLRFENHNFGVKFVFTELLKEYLMNVQLYRKVQGTRIGGIAMRKLESHFLYDINCRHPQSQFTTQILENEGKNILQELNTIFNGQKCASCNKYLVFNNELMIFMPPTVRDVVDYRDGLRVKRYYHQSCL